MSTHETVELHPGFSVKLLPRVVLRKPQVAEPAWVELLKHRWPKLRLALEAGFNELAQNAGHGPATWAHVVQPSLRAFSADEWELNCSFTWAEDTSFHFHFSGEDYRGVAIDT